MFAARVQAMAIGQVLLEKDAHRRSVYVLPIRQLLTQPAEKVRRCHGVLV
jgi:hypothetical protein